MSQVEIIFVFGFLALAIWTRETFFHVLGGVIALIFGLRAYPELHYALPLLGVGVYFLYAGVLEMVRR